VKLSVGKKERLSKLPKRRRRGSAYVNTTRSVRSRRRRLRSARKRCKWNENGDRRKYPTWNKSESRPKL
jgi:hypothetical protein